ncbi:hypothetical protein Emtol_1254 [Emticicia oligotrophica DSM 17448]|uniref:Microcin J25-processing protein McjB C-terminal domain-containing protein n=1 Tax=Emticicia oligotrophica (strain DSM 17448 / CIP 109782 / MTCC 6937 / GPTSA100-15) TaxID=929562 RepID=A0ABM5MZ36_EMTOG|nr:lasso peptide biosynthesis B2 protein [Emticicia oligotrophica]AFK02403.1 hypothetical protein Emtol_1254 [Emticicia oligotrophica DSM 17448]
MKILRKIISFFRFTLRQKLLIIVVCFLAIYSFILFRFFKHAAKFKNIYKDVNNEKDFDKSFIKDIRLAINVVGKYIFWENVCRHQAYQAMILFSFFNIPYQIFVGFKKNLNGQIEGHAWTVVNGEMITGFCKVEEYVVQNVY